MIRNVSLHCPYSVHTKFPERPYSVYDALTARKKLLTVRLRRAHDVHTVRTQCTYSVPTALIALKAFYLFLSNVVLEI